MKRQSQTCKDVFRCLFLKSFSELMRQIEDADGGSCDVTMREILSSESDGDYGKMKDSDVLAFYMGKLDKSTPGRKLLNINFFIHHLCKRLSHRSTFLRPGNHKRRKSCSVTCPSITCPGWGEGYPSLGGTPVLWVEMGRLRQSW